MNMSSSKDPEARQRDERRFVKIVGIDVRDARRASKFRVVIRHGEKAVETFESQAKSESIVIPCETFIEIKPKHARKVEMSLEKEDGYDLTVTFEVERSDKLNIKSQRVPPTPLHVCLKSDGGITIKASIPREYGFTVDFQLGDRVTLAEVADARLKGAMESLRAKQGLIDKIKFGTDHLRLFMAVGDTVAELNLISQSIVAIVKAVFKQIEGIPKAFMDLRDVVLELAEELESRTSAAAEKAYETGLASDTLDKLIELIVDAAMEISRRYSHSRPGVLVREVFSGSEHRAGQLREKLKHHQQSIDRAFLTETKIGITEINARDARVEARKVEKEEERLLSKLLPPNDGIFGNKPACLEGTRTAVIDLIVQWAENPSSRMFWLLGVAGCGKSSIAETVARELDRTHRLTGSFFCKRDQDERRNPVRLIWALSYYLAEKDGLFRDALLPILRKQDTFVSSSLGRQFQLILEEPLTEVNALSSVARPSLLFVLDALDECEQISSVMGCLTKLTEIAPWIRIIFTSRFSQNILDSLKITGAPYEECDLFSLKYDAHNDIRTYLMHQFKMGDLRGALPDSEMSKLTSYIDRLVQKSQGLFIWIDVIVKYISRSRSGKLIRLTEVLSADERSNQEAALDSIYRMVINAAYGLDGSDAAVIRLIVNYVLAASETEVLSQDILYAMIQPSTQITQREFEDVLGLLSAIIIIDDGRVRTFHTSVLDFLSNKERCGEDIYMGPQDVHFMIALRCFEVMEHGTQERLHEPMPLPGLKFNICGLPTSYLRNDQVYDLKERISHNISLELRYSALYWFTHVHFAHSRTQKEDLSRATTLSVNTDRFLFSTRTLYWLEILSLIGELHKATNILTAIQRESMPIVSKGSKAISLELQAHLDKSFTAISTSTPHLYVSSLAWVLKGSRLYKCWHDEFSPAWALKGSLRSSSPLLRAIRCPRSIEIIAFSPDGLSIVAGTGGPSNAIFCLWDVQSGYLKKEATVRDIVLEGTQDDDGSFIYNLQALAFSADNKRIFFAANFRMHICDAETLRRAAQPHQLHNSRVSCIAIAHGSDVLASADDKIIKVWSAVSFQMLHVLEGHAGSVTSMTFSPDGGRLASESSYRVGNEWEGELIVWSMQGPNPPFEMSMIKTDSKIVSLAFSHDGQRLASFSSLGTITAWDTACLDQLAYRYIGEYVKDILWAPGDVYILLNSSSGLDCWDPLSDSVQGPLSPKVSSARNAALSPNGRLITACDGDLFVWDISALLQNQKAGAAEPQPANFGNLLTACFCGDGSHVLTGYTYGVVERWDVDKVNVISQRETPMVFNTRMLGISLSGLRCATTTPRNGTVSVWNMRVGELFRTVDIGGVWIIKSAVFSPDASHLAVYSIGKDLRVFDITTDPPEMKLAWETMASVSHMAFSLDSRLLAISCPSSVALGNAHIRLWDTEKGVMHGEAFDTECTALAFSRKGDLLAVGTDNGEIRLWDIQNCAFRAVVLTGHQYAVTAMVFSRSKRFLYSGSGDCTVRFWDVEQAMQIGPSLRGHEKEIRSISLSPDYSRIITTSWDGTARVWDCQAFLWEVSEEICRGGIWGEEGIPAQISTSGWLRTKDSEGGLLFWIPEERRNAVREMSKARLPDIPSGRPIHINWDKLLHGERWIEVRRVGHQRIGPVVLSSSPSNWLEWTILSFLTLWRSWIKFVEWFF